MTTSPVQKIYIYIGIGILSVFVLWFFLLRPEMLSSTKLISDFREQRVFLATLLKEQENLATSNKDFTAVSTQIESLKPIILKTDESLTFISDVESYADEEGVDAKLNLSQLSSSTEVQDVPLVIRVKGTLEKTMNYIHRLESSQYYIAISSVNITPVNATDVTVTLNTHTYWIEKAL